MTSHQQQQQPHKLSLQDVRQHVSTQNDGESVASGIMDQVLTNATERMIGNHLDRLSIPYTVRCISQEMLDYISCVFVGQDTGDIFPPGWQPDVASEKVDVDTWARSAMPVRAPPKKGDEALEKPGASQLTVPGGNRRVVSIVDRNPSMRRQQQQQDHSGSRQNLNASTNSGGVERLSSTVSGLGSTARTASRRAMNQNEDGSARSGSATSPLQQPRGTVQITTEEMEYTLAVASEAKKRQDAKALADKINAQIDDLKSKSEFTVDGATGKVIPLKALDPRAGPSGGKKADLRFTVTSKETATAEDLAKKGAVGGAQQRAMQPKRPKREIAEFYQSETTYGPMVEAMQPGGGVVVKDNEGMKKGDLKLPKTKLSKTEYRKIFETQQMDMGDGGGGDGEERMTPQLSQTSPPGGDRRKSVAPGAQPQQQQRMSITSNNNNVPQQAARGSQQQEQWMPQQVAQLPSYGKGGTQWANPRGGQQQQQHQQKGAGGNVAGESTRTKIHQLAMSQPIQGTAPKIHSVVKVHNKLSLDDDLGDYE